MDVKKFVENVEILCKIKGVTGTKACLESGLSRSFLTDFKSKSQNPRIESLEKLADYFGVTISELLGEAPFHAVESDTISDADRHLLDAYHQATPDTQKAVIRVLNLDEKNGSKSSGKAM